MTDEDDQNFKKVEKCHICDKKYTGKDVRVRDHYHITGTSIEVQHIEIAILILN